MLRKLFFYLQYLFFDPPWDTGISPPELLEYIEGHPPGRALDLGCGTGTNAVTLGKHGWQVLGVDYVPRAIKSARRKARKAGLGDRVEFRVGDVLNLELREGSFDLILDIGCFHTFAGGEVKEYQQVVSQALRPGGSLLLYAHLQVESGDSQGAAEEDFQVLQKSLQLSWREDGMEGESRPSAWLEFTRPKIGQSAS